MGKIKHTKNELKRQKDALKMFTRYLPTLMLKKQQLQLEIIKILHKKEELETDAARLKEAIDKWVAVFSEDVSFKGLISVEKVHTSTGNIAGIDIPLFEKIDFKENKYDLFLTPLWVDHGIEAFKEYVTLKIRNQILARQLSLVREELRITTQRVNLFEKVKIPEARENIRKVRIFLGDMQTASVVTGKIAKTKIGKKLEARNSI